MNRNFVVFLFFLSALHASGQFFPSADYPRNLFRNPLNIPISLAANFGELRSNHYHMGLDIRTEHRENLPVYAAADGYVYRVKIEPFGFGQAIYIRHEDGYLTLYAHLNAFYPALAAWVEDKQYELKKWATTLDPPPGLFKVKKGELIALSGNRGGSQGPHLHFEIRSFPSDINLNPLLFGLPVKDDTPPVIRSLSVYDRNRSFYEQEPAFVPVKGASGHYTTALPEIICNTPNPGFGVLGFDTQTGSNNPNGLFEGIIYDNNIAVSGFRMNRISYNETIGINAHVDYPTHARGGPYYQLLFRLPGYQHSIYHEALPGGIIHLEDGQLHMIRIEIKDAYGNSSNLEFKARYQAGALPQKNFAGKMFYPGMVDGIETPDAAFYLGEGSLYDSLHLSEQVKPGSGNDLVSDLHQFGNGSVPLADTMVVRIKQKKLIEWKSNVLMKWSEGDDFEVQKPIWMGEWATGAFRSFGTFSLVLDTIPPSIRIPGVAENANLHRSSRITVQVRDNYRKIKNFRATLDGNWLLFSNDKAKGYMYFFDKHCLPGRHELKIYAEDEAGNFNSFVLHFVR